MTNGVEVKETRVSRLGVAQRITLLTASVAAVAVALFVIVVRTLPGAPTALTLPWVLWAAAFTVALLLGHLVGSRASSGPVVPKGRGVR